MFSINGNAKETLRIFSWEGYVTPLDIKNVNKILEKEKLDVEVKLIDTFASGPDQMFNVIRSGKCDVAFLTLFFIKLKKEIITKLLQEININSPRFTNYKHVLPGVKNLSMGMKEGKHLYVPYGGGTYGFWANMNKVKKSEIPKSFKDLWKKRWHKKISLNKTQIWYNIGVTLMSMGIKPFYLNTLLKSNKREEAIHLSSINGNVQKKLNDLYEQSSNFWVGGTEFKPELEIVSSWGPEMEKRNKTTNEEWKLIRFQEGNIVWLDTINFMKKVKGNKLIAAEHFANYFIGKTVQERVVKDLSMISISKEVKKNPRVNENPTIFKTGNFVPPYGIAADNLMQTLSSRSMDNLKK